ncbi:choice-of-anchor D domain-containing protein [Corallococcus exiguus]|uniref:choice-of-anchor D domain-containing protein n=1 Tax=Corallococcus exiguus TaxID=83462 RepID=UPI00155F7F06|nr:choice-of-anchor D domain-containing protein [Corallococcus exiguus]NRD56450.1 choice-of-anchor D domain-containing protein [Corallococcus exiguus]
MQRILFILTAALCVLTACGPEAEKPPTVADRRDALVQAPGTALRPDDPVPSLKLEDDSIDFDPQLACDHAVNSLTLLNLGSTEFKVHRATITGGFTFDGVYDATNTRCDTNCPVPAVPATSTTQTTIRVGFSPTQPGPFNGTLTLYTDDPAAPSLTVALAGKATGPLIILGQPSVVFGGVDVGSSASHPVTVINLGDVAFPLDLFASAPFSVTSASPTVPARGQTTLTVTFTPVAAVPVMGALRLTQQTMCNTPPSATLSGVGVSPPKLVLNRTVMTFPQTPVGSVSPSQEVTLRNEGGSLLKVTALTLQPASVAFAADTAVPIEIPPGEIRQLKLSFTPATSGSVSTTMSFINTGATVPTLDLSGATPPVVATKLVLNSTTIDFGTRDACASTEGTVVLRNQSGSDRKIQNASITGGFSLVGLYKAPTTPCAFPCTVTPATQANPNEVSVKVAFGQKQPGGFQGTLTLYTDDPDMPSMTVSLSGTAEGPLLVFEQPVVDFGRQKLGTASPQRQVKVLNLGNKQFSNTPSVTSPFSLTPGPLTIPAGQSGQLAVTFEPTSRTQSTGTLTLTNSSSTTLCPTPPTASLKGEGFQPATLALSRPSLTFAETSVGATSAAQEVTVRNDGDELLSVTQLALEKNLHFELNPSGFFSLAPGDTYLLKVSFKPTSAAAGLVSDTLTFVGAGTGAPKLTLQGTAKAVPPGRLELNRAQVAFPQTAVGNTSTAQEFTLTNTGGKPVTVSRLTFAQNLHFKVDTAGPFTLAPGQTQTLKVTFKPTADGETLLDELAFETTDDPSAPKLKVSGSATPGTACIGISPLSITFAEQAAGDEASEQQKVTVTNTGTVALTVTPTVTTGSGAYSVSPSTAFTLAPGSAGRELFVTFDPGETESGGVQGLLSFGTSPASSCVSDVPLQGAARKTLLEISTTTLTFNDYTVGDPPLPQPVILTNRTSWPVKVFSVSAGVLDPFTIDIPTGGLTVAKNGGTAQVMVTFAATTSGEYSKTLQLKTDASKELPPVLITGRALSSELAFAKNPVDLPNVTPGGESTADATLRNTGNQALFLSKITPESDDTPEGDDFFEVVDFLPQTIQPGGETTVKVRFHPMTSTGTLQTRLRFFTTNNRQLPQVLVVKGNSNGPNAIFTTDKIDFGYKQNRGTHVNLSLNVSNSSSLTAESIKVTKAVIDPSGTPFSVDPISTTAEPELAQGVRRPQPFRVTYSPSNEGVRSEAYLEISYKGMTSNIETTRRFKLEGIGAEASFTTSKSTVIFPATQPGSSIGTSLDIINTGKVDVDLAAVASDLGAFSVDVVGWPNPIIPVGGTRKVDITFTPPQISGNYSANLSLATKPPAVASLMVELSGVAAVAQLQMERAQLFFNEVPRHTTSTQSVLLSNSGFATLRITSATGSGPFSTSLPAGKTYPVFLEKAESVLLNVTFRPDSALPVTGTVQIESNSKDSLTHTIQVSGKGTIPALVLPNPTPEFAPQALNVEGEPQPLVVKNEGSAPLVVYSVTVPDQFCLRETAQKTSVCPSSLSPTVPAFTVAPGVERAFYVSAKPTQLLTIERNLVIASNADPSSTPVKLSVDGVGGVSLSPSNVDFGRVNFGSSLEKTVTVTNTGITDANISVSLPPGSSEFSVQQTLPKVPANSSASVKFYFTPQGSTGGIRTTKATVLVEASSQAALELSLQGTATQARLAVTRKDNQAFDGTLDFGGVRVNTTSEALGLRLTHALPAGSADAGTEASTLKVQDISLDAEDARSFILQKPALPLVLNAGTSMDVSVQFRPDAQRRFNAVLRITSEDSQAGTMLVTLGGRGRTNQLSLSTPTLEFGARVAESSASAIRFVRLTNESLQPLVVRGLEIIAASENSEPSHFSLDSAPTLPFTLAAQESKDVFVKYVPRPDVTSKANLLVVTNDLESPEAQVSLSGRGLSTVFRALNRTVDFGTVRQAEPATTKVVLTNDTTQELVVMPPKVEGPQATNFVVVSPVLGAEGRALPQGDSLTLDLKYDTSVIGASKATLVLGTKDQERAALVALSGISVASFLTIEPMELDLGWVDIGATSTPRTVTLTNQSASPARLSVVSNSNPAFEIDASALDAELAPGAQTTVGVTFRGEVGGPAEGTLKLRLRGETTTEASLTLKAQARTLGGTGGGCACGTSGDGGAALALLLLLGLGLARQGRRAQSQKERVS